jgi:hypothetical protein
LSENEWNGAVSMELKIADLRPAGAFAFAAHIEKRAADGAL